MKIRNFFVVLILVASPSFAVTPDHGLIGAGAMIGTSGTVSGKYWFTKNDAFDLGVEFLDKPFAVFYSDYYRHFYGWFSATSKFWARTTPYVGVGAGVGFWDRADNCGRWRCTWSATSTGTGNGFFLRLVVGLEWLPKGQHYSVLAEIGPSITWYPTNGRTFDAFAGARYYF